MTLVYTCSLSSYSIYSRTQLLLGFDARFLYPSCQEGLEHLVPAKALLGYKGGVEVDTLAFA